MDDGDWVSDWDNVWNHDFYMPCMMTILKEVDIYYMWESSFLMALHLDWFLLLNYFLCLIHFSLGSILTLFVHLDFWMIQWPLIFDFELLICKTFVFVGSKWKVYSCWNDNLWYGWKECWQQPYGKNYSQPPFWYLYQIKFPPISRRYH